MHVLLVRGVAHGALGDQDPGVAEFVEEFVLRTAEDFRDRADRVGAVARQEAVVVRGLRFQFPGVGGHRFTFGAGALQIRGESDDEVRVGQGLLGGFWGEVAAALTDRRQNLVSHPATEGADEGGLGLHLGVGQAAGLGWLQMEQQGVEA